MSGRAGVKGGARAEPGTIPGKEIAIARRDLMAKYFADAKAALDYMISVMKDQSQPVTLRMAAAQIIMDRVWGRPAQAVEIEQRGNVNVVVTETKWTPN